ncbi:MAG TPA: heterodisulfide reductase-related iron-sulfur binding cluster [Pseudomonadales bacterium]|jgi:glycerol-3-phosphate dehydrogenase subunit C|nr:heterodisulfide reductase-related iron-sulfur binding cluster [Pseudomonadales bacterium]
MAGVREGNLEAPKRRPIDWQNPEFYAKDSLYAELERVFDICHGCRRCVSLCDSFPTLFDLVDESSTLEVDGVDKADYRKVVEQCYLCDLCAETKCPYLPPHEWAVDFPHLMLRAKAYRYQTGDTKWRDRLITTTDPVFKTLSTPGIGQLANAVINSPAMRTAIDKTIGLNPKAPMPKFHTRTLSRRLGEQHDVATPAQSTDRTRGKVAIFVTCYGEHNEPEVVEDMVAVLNHNGIAVRLLQDARCCGMPKLELGDLKAVEKLKDANLPIFLEAIDAGYDLMSPIPSCVLMYKQEVPLMFPNDANVARVKAAFFDPFEYLMLRHRAGLVKTDFSQKLGTIAYHVACHQRVQNIGMKTRDFMQLIPGTEVATIERCSGHDGTYALKSETYEKAMKIARPVITRVEQSAPDHYGSDCPMAGRMIQHGLEMKGSSAHAEHPLTLVRRAYGI